MEGLEPEDAHQFENLNSNHECHSCADSSAPQVTKEKELTLCDLCSSQKGLEQHLHGIWGFLIPRGQSHGLTS